MIFIISNSLNLHKKDDVQLKVYFTFVTWKSFSFQTNLPLFHQLNMSSNENENVPPKVSKSKFVVSKNASKTKYVSIMSLKSSPHSIDTVNSRATLMSTKELPAIATVSQRDTQDPQGFLDKRGYRVIKEIGAGGFAT